MDESLRGAYLIGYFKALFKTVKHNYMVRSYLFAWKNPSLSIRESETTCFYQEKQLIEYIYHEYSWSPLWC